MKLQRMLMYMLVLACGHAAAQERDRLSVQWTDNSFHRKDSSYRIAEWEARAQLPIIRQERLVLGTGIQYRRLEMMDFPTTFSRSLNGLSMQLYFVRRFDDRRSLSFAIQYGLFSDFADITHKDIRWSSSLRYRVRYSPKLSAGVGLGYARQFFGTQIVPFVDIDWRPNDKWRLTGAIPVKPQLIYTINDRWDVSLLIRGEGSSYRLLAKEFQNRFVQVNQWTLNGELGRQVLHGLRLHAGAGFNLRQTCKLFEDNARTALTIFTIPVRQKQDPVETIKGRGFVVYLGLSLSNRHR